MSALSDYLEAKYLEHTYNGVSFTPPSTIYLALYTADPGDADAGTEVSGGSYARARIYPYGGSTPKFTQAATDGIGKMITNADDITFTTATAPWGIITHIGLRDGSGTSNLLHHCALDEAQTIGTGGIFKIAAGQLKIRME